VIQSKGAFKNRVRAWARKLGVDVKIISIRKMKNKWASYTTNNQLIIFDSELLNMDRELSDYIIVHELLHGIVPNHGKLWKSLLLSYMPDWQVRDKKLKKRV
jgi:predicted metal-dependent hydrolase